MRAHLAELGIVAAQGRDGVKALIGMASSDQLPAAVRDCLGALVMQLKAAHQQILGIERRIQAQHRASETSRRLETIPGIGVIGATALAATVTDPTVFKSGREFAAWIGLVPRQSSTGGKERLGPISKQGDRYFAQVAHRRCDGSDPARALSPGETSLANPTAGAAAGQGGGRSSSQQDGTDRLGDVSSRRGLPSAAPSGGSGLTGLAMTE
jgi:transposase